MFAERKPDCEERTDKTVQIKRGGRSRPLEETEQIYLPEVEEAEVAG